MKKIYYYLLPILLSGSCCYSIAADVEVQINGNVVAESCKLTNSGGNINVVFDPFTPQTFKGAGSTSTTELFTVHLENCTGNVNNLSYQFTGVSDLIDSDLLKIQTDNSTEEATGIAVEILDSSKKRIPLNSQQKFGTTITDGSYDLTFYLQYRATSATVTPGNASSIMYLDIYYD